MSSNNRPGSWATVQKGKLAGRTGQVVAFIQEECDGIPVQNGITYHVLQFPDTPDKIAFRRNEIDLHR